LRRRTELVIEPEVGRGTGEALVVMWAKLSQQLNGSGIALRLLPMYLLSSILLRHVFRHAAHAIEVIREHDKLARIFVAIEFAMRVQHPSLCVTTSVKVPMWGRPLGTIAGLENEFAFR
jgi:hypothetical protein